MDSIGLAAALAALVVGGAVGVWRRRTNGRVREQVGARVDPAVLTALGVPAGRPTLLQISSAFCAPCRALRRISAEVAGLVPGVQHIEVDAESHLDEVRALDVWRTPSLFVLEADGRIARRASGVPTKAQLIAALGELETIAGGAR